MEAFRVKLPALWRLSFPGLMLGAIVSSAINLLDGRAFTWPNTLPLMAVAAVLVLLQHWLQPTLAGPQGLRVFNLWGLRRPVAWGDIAQVDFAAYYVVMPSLRLRTAGGHRYWIPLQTQRLARLHALAREAGGANHPLTRALETPLHAL